MFCCCFSASCPSPFIIDEHSFAVHFFPDSNLFLLLAMGDWMLLFENGGGFCLLFTLLTHMILVHSPNNKNQNRYEAKRQEIEAWLMRMEAKSERMGKAAAQVDGLDFTLLDSQQKEQKVTFKNPENLANLSSPAARIALHKLRIENVLKLVMNNFSWGFSLCCRCYIHTIYLKFMNDIILFTMTKNSIPGKLRQLLT